MAIQTHFPIFFLFFITLSVSGQFTDLYFPGFRSPDLQNLTLTGIAEFEQNGILKLTNDTSRLKGQCLYSSPIPFKNTTTGKAFSFSTTFALAVVPEYPKLGGHGLAFFVSAARDTKSLPSQYLGLLNASDLGNFSNHLIAIEFDTVQDFEFQDINDNHIGVDINSMVSNASAVAAYYSDDLKTLTNLTIKSGKPILAWIEYDSTSNLLNVTISPTSVKPRKPVLSFGVDLSPITEDFMYVGFSASTGLLASSHYVLGWSFKTNGEARNLNLASLPKLPRQKTKHTALTVGLSLSSVILAIAVTLIAVYIFIKIKNADVIEDWELEIGPQRYSYKELKKATKKFSEKELLGAGGFGKVYKGTLPGSKMQVAVKRVSHESKQGLREFVSEIASIGRLRHRNLVQLLGWCRRRGDLLLVYDFMANGSLDRFLFDEKSEMVLNWEQRFKIIKDVASALLYLHEGYEQVVIHRDVKASNVLIDSELNGRLGDFGLARLYEHGANPGTTRVVGTLGYLAPELPRTGKATAGSDVFAFGALALEVCCGRRPIDPKAQPEELVLVDWILDNFRQGRLLVVVDPKLNNDYDMSQVSMVLKLGLMCSKHLATERPSMRQVIRYLDGEADVPDNLKISSGFDGMKSGHGEGFDDFVNSFESTTSFGNMQSYESTASFTDTHLNGRDTDGGDDASFITISTSPISLLRETR